MARRLPIPVRHLAALPLVLFLAHACSNVSFPTGDQTCADDTTLCDSACVDTAASPDHCGACGQACAPGELCTEGACSASCPAGTTACEGSCVDTALDPSHCGGCGESCEAGEVCSAGACGWTCTGGTLQCGNVCVETELNPLHCGGCDQACSDGEVCSEGTCGLTCSGGVTLCGEACVDTAVDPAHCGACDAPCPAGQVCSFSGCVAPCGVGAVLCGGDCVDLSTNVDHCGGCSSPCSPSEVCDGGVCACPAGQSACGTECVVLDSDPDHCGACGEACGAGSACFHGLCSPLGSWSMFGNDPGHSGVAAESGVPPLSEAWSVPVSTVGLNPVVVAQGRVFVTSHPYFQPNTPLVALNINDGSTLWSHNFGSIYRAGHPAVVDGKVYVQQNKGTGSTTNLWTFDAVTGAVAWLSPFGSQWERFWSPLVVGDRVYINGGTYGGLYGFDASDGAELFFNGTLEQYDEWTPAYRNGLVYTFVEGNLRTHDPETGAVLGTVSVPWDWSGWSSETAPVFGASSHAYVIAPPNLHAIDTATNLITWSATANFTGTPAVAGDVIYAVSASTLHARDAVTGSHLWTFPGDLDLSYPPIVANDFVYVASDDNVYAVDTTTHTAAWTAPVGGWLSIAAGKLFVARADGVLSAFDLSP